MSAGAWTVCPKCDARNPDAEPDDEWYGTVRVDYGFVWDAFKFSVSFWCTECDWEYELTEKDVNYNVEDEEDCPHTNMNISVDGRYCEDCDEVFEDNTGSNLMGG